LTLVLYCIKIAKGLAENWPAIKIIIESPQVYKSREFTLFITCVTELLTSTEF